MSFKKSCVLIGTPGSYTKMVRPLSGLVKYHSVVLEKIDLLMALDLKEEMDEIADEVKD